MRSPVAYTDTLPVRFASQCKPNEIGAASAYPRPAEFAWIISEFPVFCRISFFYDYFLEKNLISNKNGEIYLV